MKLDLSTKEGYDIASAIRGPDARDEIASYLKAVFTAPIRNWVMDNEESSGCWGWIRYPNTHPRKLAGFCCPPDEIYTYAIENEWVHHYIWHTHAALTALSRYVDDWRLWALRRATWTLVDVDPVRRELFCYVWRELEKTWA